MATSQSKVATFTHSNGVVTVTFDTAMDSANYVVFANTFKSTGDATSCGGDVDYSSRTTNGFNLVGVVEDGYISYITQITYDATLSTVIPTSERLSRDWNGLRLWLEAASDIKADGICAFTFEGLRLINNILPPIVNEFAGLLANRYETRATSVTITSSKINLAPYRLMSAGGELKLRLEFSETSYVSPVSPDDLQVFRSSAQQNKKRIVWTVEGDFLRFGFGSSLTTPTTATLIYPRIPTELTDWSEMVDLPDGSLMELARLRLKQAIRERYNQPKQDYTQEAREKVKAVYESMQSQVSVEEIDQKVKALF